MLSNVLVKNSFIHRILGAACSAVSFFGPGSQLLESSSETCHFHPDLLLLSNSLPCVISKIPKLVLAYSYFYVGRMTLLCVCLAPAHSSGSSDLPLLEKAPSLQYSNHVGSWKLPWPHPSGHSRLDWNGTWSRCQPIRIFPRSYWISERAEFILLWCMWVKENETDAQTEAEKKMVSVLVVFKSLAEVFLSPSCCSDPPRV